MAIISIAVKVLVNLIIIGNLISIAVKVLVNLIIVVNLTIMAICQPHMITSSRGSLPSAKWVASAPAGTARAMTTLPVCTSPGPMNTALSALTVVRWLMINLRTLNGIRGCWTSWPWRETPFAEILCLNHITKLAQDAVDCGFRVARGAHAAVLVALEEGRVSWMEPEAIEAIRRDSVSRVYFEAEGPGRSSFTQGTCLRCQSKTPGWHEDPQCL